MEQAETSVLEAASATDLSPLPISAQIVASGEEVDESKLPQFYALWQGQSMPENYRARRLAKGRLEIFLIHPYSRDSGAGKVIRKYLEDWREAIGRHFQLKRQPLGLLNWSPLLSIPAIIRDRNGNTAMQLRVEFNCVVA